jgi:hypothetical protein
MCASAGVEDAIEEYKILIDHAIIGCFFARRRFGGCARDINSAPLQLLRRHRVGGFGQLGGLELAQQLVVVEKPEVRRKLLSRDVHRALSLSGFIRATGCPERINRAK